VPLVEVETAVIAVRPRLLHQQAKAFARCGVVVEAWGRVDRAGGGDVFANGGGLL
jgi:hypothetical protein